VVDAVLAGSPERVKERTLGVEVFGRELEYDTNHDSVVRNAAIEVRKRLAQYYLEPGHEDEIRIALPQGGYVPEFSVPPLHSPAAVADAASPERTPPRPKLPWMLAVAAAALCVAAIFWVYARHSQSDLDRFWAPLVQDPSGVMICVGQPSHVYSFARTRREELDAKMAAGLSATAVPEAPEKTTLTLRDLSLNWKNFLYFGDSVCMTKISGLIQSGNKPVAVRGAMMTAYEDMRGRPVVLIGLNNNRWTQRFTAGLRYYFVRRPEQQKDELRDRLNPNKPPWVVNFERSEDVFDDYAVVSRVLDPSTEKPLVAIAAVTQSGTQSAGDFITSPSYIREAFREAPSNWPRRNVQIVLKTRIVTGAAGPPQVVATHVW
jgi:hypothetical protein